LGAGDGDATVLSNPSVAAPTPVQALVEVVVLPTLVIR
jgi:hypothetical protein